MTTDDANVAWVPVEKVEVGVTLADVVKTLAAEASNMVQPPAQLDAGALAQAAPATTQNPELADLVQQMHQLSTQLADVITKIDAIDPNFLAAEAEGEA